MTLTEHALQIGTSAVETVRPDEAVRSALTDFRPSGKVVLVAIGKAAWRMARAAREELGEAIAGGIVITKEGHSEGAIGPLTIREASHPILDERTLSATAEALEMVEGLTAEDTVLFLVSGGGSALFEKPLPGITLEDLQSITGDLLRGGADIVTVNKVRKRCSLVKAGRFAETAAPAKVEALILSDVLGDRLDSIASGPAAPDESTIDEVREIVKQYKLQPSPAVADALATETPKSLDNVRSRIVGSVSVLCAETRKATDAAGFPTLFLTSTLQGEAREAGRFFAEIAREIRTSGYPRSAPCAVLAGGETVVHVTGEGLGGRNQEMALAAAIALDGLPDVAFLALASDGTDGPNDAAGGIVDGTTAARMREAGLNPEEMLGENDSYHALEAVGALIRTGPTGTNVNDIALLMCG